MHTNNPAIQLKRNEKHPPKLVHKCSYFIHNNQKLETLQYPSTNESINKIYIYLFNKISLNSGT